MPGVTRCPRGGVSGDGTRISGVAHSHVDTQQPVVPLAGRTRRLLAAAVAPFALATAVGLVLLWPDRANPPPAPGLEQPPELVDATVTGVDVRPCGAGQCATALVRVTSGPDAGRARVLADLSFGPGQPRLRDGDRIVVGRTVEPGSGRVDYYFADFQRRIPLALLALGFALLVVAVARWRGVAALAGLAVTWLVLVRFVIPAVLEGSSPLGVALTGGALIVFVVLYLSHGVSARTTTAVLGTLASLAVTGALAAAAVAGTRLTGFSSEEATYLQVVNTRISLSALVLGGIVIGALGVLNDVTVTQTSAVWELRAANAALGIRELYRSAMRIGRDHIASVVDTLVLAYAGASLPLLILFTVANQPVGNVVTGEVVAEEIVRTLVGSVGLVASVPITTALAAAVVTYGMARGSAPTGEDGEGTTGSPGG